MNAVIPSQLTLSLHLQDDARFDHYYEAENGAALQAVKSLTTPQPLDWFIYLWGAQGVGASHLLQACCRQYADGDGVAFYLSLDEVIDYGPEVFESMETVDLLCLDNLEAIAGKSDWEQALFHLFNRLRDQGKRLLVACHHSPAEISVVLPDLLSRLRSGLCFHLQPLSDADKCRALQQRAQTRGFELNDEAAQYIISRHQRDTTTLFEALDILDQASLMAQRKLTIPFIKSVFNW